MYSYSGEGVSLGAKAQAGVMSDFPNSRIFVFGSELRIYNHPVFSSVTGVQLCPSNDPTKCQCLVDKKTIDT